MTQMRQQFKYQNDKMSYYDFFTFLGMKLRIELASWEEDALEGRLDRLGMAFIEFNEFNEFCMIYGINWSEPLIENDNEAILDAKLNVSYDDYKVTPDDFFMGCSTMLTSEKAALSKCELIYRNAVYSQNTPKYIDPDFGPKRKSDIFGCKMSMYKTGVPPKGYPDPLQCDWVFGEQLCAKGQTA